jgi:Holliday junction DNA helicase RuvB
MLYPIMEDRVISAVGDPRLRLHLNPLMVVGATTEPGEMPRPLRERFVLHVEIPEYTVEQIQQIAAGQARRLGRVEWLAGAVGVVAGACKGIPRISGQLLWQARDFVLARGASVVTAEDVRCVLERAGIGQNGLDPVDQAVIRALRDAPMGLEALASVVGQDAALIRREHEPYLLRRGYIRRTGRGRELTESGKELKI